MSSLPGTTLFDRRVLALACGVVVLAFAAPRDVALDGTSTFAVRDAAGGVRWLASPTNGYWSPWRPREGRGYTDVESDPRTSAERGTADRGASTAPPDAREGAGYVDLGRDGPR